MAAGTRFLQTPLRDVINQVEDVHKVNIKEYAGGHLNEQRLNKPKEYMGFKSWASAQTPDTKRRTKLLPPKKESKSRKKMGEALYQFSLGTSGSVPVSKSRPARLSSADRYLDPITERTHTAESEPGMSSRSPRRSKKERSKVLVEELTPHDIMLPVSNHPVHPSRAWATEVDRSADDGVYSQTPRTSKGTQRDQNLMQFKYHFTPGLTTGLTKRDQMNNILDFEYGVMRKQDATEQKILTGQRAAEHLENSLKQGLDDLQYNGYGPNFHRLQVYSRTWEDAIQDSTTFGHILKAIKREYDGYISHLMDRAPQHGLLFHQIQQLSGRGTSNPRRLAGARGNVEDLELDAKALLEVNDRLREEIRKEEELAAEAPELDERAVRWERLMNRSLKSQTRFNAYQEQSLDIGDQLDELKATILQKMDSIGAIKRDLREEFVPSTVVNHLDQCVKETEVEIQKLLTQKEFLQKDVGKLEHDLTEAVETADTSDRDTKRVWRKMNAVRKVTSAKSRATKGTAVSGDGVVITCEESDEGSDDEGKWSWYIS